MWQMCAGTVFFFFLFFGDGSIGKSIFADCISMGHESFGGSRWCRRFSFSP